MANGNKMIAKGMTLLTNATDTIQKGIDATTAEMIENDKEINTLLEKNNILSSAAAKAQKIITNFNKNILGID